MVNNLQLKMFPAVRTPKQFGDIESAKRAIAFMTLESYVKLKNELGHTKPIDLLKLDVEGGEYALFASLFESPESLKSAPFQISFESHWWHRGIGHAMLSLQLMDDLWRFGYRFMSHEVQDDSTCFEWTVLRVFC